MASARGEHERDTGDVRQRRCARAAFEGLVALAPMAHRHGTDPCWSSSCSPWLEQPFRSPPLPF